MGRGYTIAVSISFSIIPITQYTIVVSILFPSIPVDPQYIRVASILFSFIPILFPHRIFSGLTEVLAITDAQARFENCTFFVDFKKISKDRVPLGIPAKSGQKGTSNKFYPRSPPYVYHTSHQGLSSATLCSFSQL